MQPNIFPEHNQLPNTIAEMTQETGLNALSPGETAWTVPWALKVNENGAISINTGMSAHDKRGGTVKMKVISDFDGLVIDASAFNRDDVEDTFKANDKAVVIGADTSDQKEVIGVIYPFIKDSRGIDPRTVKAFNDEQRAARERFRDYYKETFGKDYIFADDN